MDYCRTETNVVLKFENKYLWKQKYKVEPKQMLYWNNEGVIGVIQQGRSRTETNVVLKYIYCEWFK